MTYKHIGVGLRRINWIFSRSASFKPNFRRDIGVSGFALLSVPITTFCLGTWQVKRRSWKLNLIEEVTTKNKAAPVELPDDLQKLFMMEYQRIHVRGTYDHSKELYVGPRQLLSDKDEGGGGLISSRSQSGYLIITPFHVTDKNITILVNRGWVPRNKIDPGSRPEGQVSKEIELIGTVRLPEKRPQFSPKNQTNTRSFFYRDVPKMVELTGAAPIFVDADASTTIPGGPVGGQTRITFRNEHMSYIVTWYSLCAATLYMWYRKYVYKIKTL